MIHDIPGRHKFLCSDIYADQADQLHAWVMKYTKADTITVCGHVFTKVSTEPTSVHAGWEVVYSTKNMKLVYIDHLTIQYTSWEISAYDTDLDPLDPYSRAVYIGSGKTPKDAFLEMQSSIQEDIDRNEGEIAEAKAELAIVRKHLRLFGKKKELKK